MSIGRKSYGPMSIRIRAQIEAVNADSQAHWNEEFFIIFEGRDPFWLAMSPPDYRHLDFTLHAWIFEPVGVAQALIRDELKVFAAKRMTVARGEIPERHFERPAQFRLQVVHAAGVAIRRQPLRQGIGFEERAIDLLWGAREDAVETDCIGHVASPCNALAGRRLVPAFAES